MSSLAVLQVVALRTWRATMHRPVHLTFSFFQPIFWLLFFGTLMQRYPVELLPPGVDYRSFVLPGICAMTVLLGASQSGIGLIRDFQNGFLQRMLLTPASALALLGGKVLADSLRLVVQALLILGLGMALGLHVELAVVPLLAGVLALLIFALAFCSLSCMIALRARRQESMAAFVHLVNLPVFFTSTALVQRSHVPESLQTIMALNPLSRAVDILRSATLTGTADVTALSWGILLGLAGLFFALAAMSMASAVTVSAWDSR